MNKGTTEVMDLLVLGFIFAAFIDFSIEEFLDLILDFRFTSVGFCGQLQNNCADVILSASSFIINTVN